MGLGLDLRLDDPTPILESAQRAMSWSTSVSARYSKHL